MLLEERLSEIKHAFMSPNGTDVTIDFFALSERDDDVELVTLPVLGEHGYVAKGWSHIIAAYAKTGKTELITSLCIEWAASGERVLLLSEEQEMTWALRNRYRRAALPESVSGRFQIACGLGMEPEALRHLAFAGDATVVIIDTVRNLLNIDDENDNSKVGAALKPWVAESQRRGVTLIFSHHDNKDGGAHGKGIAGAGAFLGAVDRAIEIDHDSTSERRRKLKVTGRLVTVEPMVYEMGDHYELTALGAAADLRARDFDAQVLGLLGDDWTETAAIEAAFDKPKPSRRKLLESLTRHAVNFNAERDPPMSKGQQSGVRVRWRITKKGKDKIEAEEPTN